MASRRASNWASYGLDAPVANATLEDLSSAQRAVVASLQGVTAVGELVGKYQDHATTTYRQIQSTYNGGVPSGGHALLEDRQALLQVDYKDFTGRRTFVLAKRTDNGTLVRDPNWYFQSNPDSYGRSTTGYADDPVEIRNGMVEFTNAEFQDGRDTTWLRAWNNYQTALTADTESVTRLSAADRAAISYQYKYWGNWVGLVGHWVDNDDGSGWPYDEEEDVPEWTNQVLFQKVSTTSADGMSWVVPTSPYEDTGKRDVLFNVGYGHSYKEAIAKIDGHTPRSMEDFVARLSAARGVVEIETTSGGIIILDADEVRKVTPKILTRYHIPRDRTPGLPGSTVGAPPLRAAGP